MEWVQLPHSRFLCFFRTKATTKKVVRDFFENVQKLLKNYLENGYSYRNMGFEVFTLKGNLWRGVYEIFLKISKNCLKIAKKLSRNGFSYQSAVFVLFLGQKWLSKMSLKHFFENYSKLPKTNLGEIITTDSPFLMFLLTKLDQKYF